METGTKVAIGLGVGALVIIGGVVAYSAFSDSSGHAGSSSGGGSSQQQQQQQQPPDQTAAILGLIGTSIQSATQIATVAMQNQRSPAEGTSVQNQFGSPQNYQTYQQSIPG